jgi:hypothetical protein
LHNTLTINRKYLKTGMILLCRWIIQSKAYK